MKSKPYQEKTTTLPKKSKSQSIFIKQIHVKKESGLLDFLLENVIEFSRNKIKGLLKRRQIAVDGVPVAQFDFKVHPGDTVFIAKERLVNSKQPKAKQKIDIIYEDDQFLAINKPNGLLSIASNKEKEQTAYRLASDYVRKDNPRARLFVVHRIDKETSGVLLFAKNVELKDQLQKEWNDLVIKRGYYAIVMGQVKQPEATLKHYLKETTTHLMYISSKQGDGQLAITHYKLIKSNEKYSLLDIKIDTGRKNQIRVQLRHINHPVIGDDKYDTLANPLNRLGLHAYELTLKNPIDQKQYVFKATMPNQFKSLFGKKEMTSKLAKPLVKSKKSR